MTKSVEHRKKEKTLRRRAGFFYTQRDVGESDIITLQSIMKERFSGGKGRHRIVYLINIRPRAFSEHYPVASTC